MEDRPKSLIEDRPLHGAVTVLVFLMFAFGWLLVVGVLQGLFMVAMVLVKEGPAALAKLSESSDLLMDAATPAVIGAGAIVQFAGLIPVAIILAKLTKRPLKAAFGLYKPLVFVIPIALLGGLTVGLFPGWIVEQLGPLIERFHLDTGSLELITKTLTTGSIAGRAVMLVAVCLSAPLFEELVFRGFLWDALARTKMPTWAVWLATSCLFALFHIDPVHVFAVLFVGLFLGWLRWTGKSVWVAVLGHFANNTLAAVLVVTGVDETAADGVPLWMAALAGGTTITLCAIAWFFYRRRN
jgi:uncharacterized protein